MLLLLLQPSWISVDFDNWRDWEHEEDEGKAEYDQYMDVSGPHTLHCLSCFHMLLRCNTKSC